jgi:membrane protein DedA with SNARE-associated domain
MSSHEIHHLLHEYGLSLVFVIVALQALGAPLPGTTALIAAALYAATAHGLPIAGVTVAGAIAALAGTTAGFALGRWRGEPLVVDRRPPAPTLGAGDEPAPRIRLTRGRLGVRRTIQQRGA